MATLKITSDGDPHPVKAGIGNSFSNDGATSRQFPSYAIFDQDYSFTFTYRGGSNTRDPEVVRTDVQSAIGITTNGVPIFTSASAIRSLPTSLKSAPTNFTWNEIELPNDFITDACDGKPDQGGKYTYRSGAFYSKGMVGNTKFFNSSSYYSSGDVAGNFGADKLRHGGSDAMTSGHSKIIGFAFDGYPIYGPYGFENPNDPLSSVVRMRSSYQKLTTPAQGRNFNFGEVPSGAFIEDYVYNPVSETGTLDEFNGRYCKTPDYMSGTYAYFLTFEDSNLTLPEYPYIIGPSTREQRTV